MNVPLKIESFPRQIKHVNEHHVYSIRMKYLKNDIKLNGMIKNDCLRRGESLSNRRNMQEPHNNNMRQQRVVQIFGLGFLATRRKSFNFNFSAHSHRTSFKLVGRLAQFFNMKN